MCCVMFINKWLTSRHCATPLRRARLRLRLGFGVADRGVRQWAVCRDFIPWSPALSSPLRVFASITITIPKSQREVWAIIAFGYAKEPSRTSRQRERRGLSGLRSAGCRRGIGVRFHGLRFSPRRSAPGCSTESKCRSIPGCQCPVLRIRSGIPLVSCTPRPRARRRERAPAELRMAFGVLINPR